MKNQTMSIDENELLDLLLHELGALQTFNENEYPEYKNCIWFEYCSKGTMWGEVVLRHDNEQIYTVIESNQDDFNVGCTVSVDEILDIVI